MVLPQRGFYFKTGSIFGELQAIALRITSWIFIIRSVSAAGICSVMLSTSSDSQPRASSGHFTC
jgi:hypothetical protein